MEVAVENLTKKFGPVVGVDALSLDIHEGEFVAFLGPSGCGKTTTLLMVAGIYKPTDGVIRFGERVVNNMPPKDRNIGMVFQSYALYPHMTVFENISYPLKLKRMSKSEQQQRVQRVADSMGIGHLLDRRPGQLSGGQQQRVALGRALVKQPDLLLFDEPLSNLDARLRLTMRGEIKQLQKGLGITTIYVTHDQIEALTMADRIAVMSHGKLQAFDTPEDLYDRPKTLFIAEFVGNPPMNVLSGDLAETGGQLHVQAGDLAFPVSASRAAKLNGHGRTRQVTMGVRPEDVHVDPAGEIEGVVQVVEPLGREDMLDVLCNGQRLLVLTTPEQRVTAGDTVRLRVNNEEMQFFDPQTELSLLWN